MSFELPKMEVSEVGEEVIVRVWISGISEKDIELKVSEDFLEVDISKDFSKSVSGENYNAREWKSKSFNGVVSLPKKVIPMMISHDYDGKILEVRLKKSSSS